MDDPWHDAIRPSHRWRWPTRPHLRSAESRGSGFRVPGIRDLNTRLDVELTDDTIGGSQQHISTRTGAQRRRPSDELRTLQLLASTGHRHRARVTHAGVLVEVIDCDVATVW